MIFDLITIAIFITLVIIGYARGAAKSLIGIVMSFVSYLLASMLAKIIASWVYTTFILPVVTRSVTDTIAGVASGASNDIATYMPQWLLLALKMSDKDISDVFLSTGSDLSKKAVDVIDSSVQPVIVGFIALLLTLLLYLLIQLLLRKLAVKPILGLFELPVLNTLNRVLGALLGLIEALIIVSMFAYLLKLILPYIHSDVSFLNESTIYNSFIFYYFYSGNIFAALTSWIF